MLSTENSNTVISRKTIRLRPHKAKAQCKAVGRKIRNLISGRTSDIVQSHTTLRYGRIGTQSKNQHATEIFGLLKNLGLEQTRTNLLVLAQAKHIYRPFEYECEIVGLYEKTTVSFYALNTCKIYHWKDPD